MDLSFINYIINRKWNELARKDNLRELQHMFLKLESFKDFRKEFAFHLINNRESFKSQEDEDTFIHELVAKWSFIFCSILNLDITKEYVFNLATEALTKMIENHFRPLSDEDEEDPQSV